MRARAPSSSARPREMPTGQRTRALASELVDVDVDPLALAAVALDLVVLMVRLGLDLAADGRLEDVVC